MFSANAPVAYSGAETLSSVEMKGFVAESHRQAWKMLRAGVQRLGFGYYEKCLMLSSLSLNIT